MQLSTYTMALLIFIIGFSVLIYCFTGGRWRHGVSFRERHGIEDAESE